MQATAAEGGKPHLQQVQEAGRLWVPAEASLEERSGAYPAAAVQSAWPQLLPGLALACWLSCREPAARERSVTDWDSAKAGDAGWA